MFAYQYIMVDWLHNYGDEYPIRIYSEIDKNGFETRKVEIFPNNQIGYAFDSIEFGGTGLGMEPVLDLNEIAADPYETFIPKEISKEEFEKIWSMYIKD
ncbi:hypothetical protein GXN76_05020 [Kroppenstedtia pulmonis]|uniref:DUF6881 domain-containing protein n=1 Tax=Kroppenstedtia pulmonis TaxID=1380685 RepID=A0A7D4CLB2_9BACL|nr:hypothetical protein [Kroppenstedtia pulmonis]QKG83898.1 hypothetical protein GXN76_05020 [Kroppenstedtia pulmonis]